MSGIGDSSSHNVSVLLLIVIFFRGIDYIILIISNIIGKITAIVVAVVGFGRKSTISFENGLL